MSAALLEHVKNLGFHRPEEEVYVAEWDRTVLVRGMTARERDEFETSMQQPALQSNGKTRTKPALKGTPNTQNFRGRFLARCIWEGDKRPFLGVEGEQVLGDQPAMVLEDLVKAAMRLNGMTREDAEELEGNLEETEEDDSSSSSHELFTEQSMN